MKLTELLKSKPVKLTEEQFDEEVRCLIVEKQERNDESYHSDIEMLVQKNKERGTFELEFFREKNIMSKTYYWKIK